MGTAIDFPDTSPPGYDQLDDEPLSQRMVSKTIERAQRQVEHPSLPGEVLLELRYAVF